MNKKLILSISAAVLLSTSLFANMHDGKKQMPKDGMNKQACMDKMGKKPFEFKKGDMIIGKMMMLDLSSEQKEKIKTIMDNFKDDLEDPYEAFSANGFDKDKFVDAQKNNIKTMLKNRADLIEKVYAVLTKEQKKDLKTILDADRIMKKKRFEKMISQHPHKPEFHG